MNYRSAFIYPWKSIEYIANNQQNLEKIVQYACLKPCQLTQNLNKCGRTAVTVRYSMRQPPHHQESTLFGEIVSRGSSLINLPTLSHHNEIQIPSSSYKSNLLFYLISCQFIRQGWVNSSNTLKEQKILKLLKRENFKNINHRPLHAYYNDSIARRAAKVLTNLTNGSLGQAKTSRRAVNLFVGPFIVNKQYQMQKRIRQLEERDNYKQGLKWSCRANNVSCKLLNGLTLRKMQKIYKRTLEHYNSSPEKATSVWFQNQLRLLQWVLILESSLLNYPLNLFKEEDWQRVQTYFHAKPVIMLQFQSRRLLSRAEAEFHVVWSEEESAILQNILEDKAMFGRWNEVSRQLFEMSNQRFYRSGKQCRQQWYNHLDNSKKHGQWTNDEDVAILRSVLRRGHKWAEICKASLPHRTQHMVKNRFKSLLIKFNKQNQKWNANERKAIKIALGKLASEASQGRQEITIQVKSKTLPVGPEDEEQCGLSVGRCQEEEDDGPSQNALQLSNKQQRPEEEQKYQSRPNQEHAQPQTTPITPTLNTTPLTSWQQIALSSIIDHGVTWGINPELWGCYSIGLWQPYGSML